VTPQAAAKPTRRIKGAFLAAGTVSWRVTFKRNEHVAENDYFDARHIRYGAGGGSCGHTREGVDEQRQAFKEA